MYHRRIEYPSGFQAAAPPPPVAGRGSSDPDRRDGLILTGPACHAARPAFQPTRRLARPSGTTEPLLQAGCAGVPRVDGGSGTVRCRTRSCRRKRSGQLNRDYLDRDRPTDVIAFDLGGRVRACWATSTYLTEVAAANAARAWRSGAAGDPAAGRSRVPARHRSGSPGRPWRRESAPMFVLQEELLRSLADG